MSDLITLVVGVVAIVLYLTRKPKVDLGEVEPKTRRALGRFEKDE